MGKFLRIGVSTAFVRGDEKELKNESESLYNHKMLINGPQFHSV